MLDANNGRAVEEALEDREVEQVNEQSFWREERRDEGGKNGRDDDGEEKIAKEASCDNEDAGQSEKTRLTKERGEKAEGVKTIQFSLDEESESPNQGQGDERQEVVRDEDVYG